MSVGRNRRSLPVLVVLICALVQPALSVAYQGPASSLDELATTAGFRATVPWPSQLVEGEPGGLSQPAQPGGGPSNPTPEETGTVRLMAVGDVSLGWNVGRKITRRGPSAPWVGAEQLFDQADLVVANLECAISTRGEPWPSKLIHLRAPLAAAAHPGWDSPAGRGSRRGPHHEPPGGAGSLSC